MATSNYSTEQAKRDAQAAANEAADDLRDGARRMGDAAKETVNDLTNNDSVNRLKERGSDLVDAAKETGREYADRARETGREYADRARSEANRLYDEGQRRATEVAHYAEERYDEVSDMVRRKPGQALGIAAGVGFLVGLILARR
ncbi:DUF883 domain-containing protein [Paracoccus sp. TK19116]|uniref:DUF883 domain-containing protein n=1 Tax=Paracoccus albicereus TaxID=2922394 RepID=A0ABT1MNV3_9RHOB|nr:DUF883 domain-containing protein [Paracoccus albicereus]MCQ0969970.1 DUF883 domain-containing protein [Paracoccus albicereus]